MELQHTHTFRATMSRSHRKDSTYIHTSIKTPNAFDANAAINSDINSERDACMQLKKQTPLNTYSSGSTCADTRSPADTLLQHNN